MKTISRIAYSNDKKNKTRSILIMMSICLTTMLLVIISTVGNGLDSFTEKSGGRLIWKQLWSVCRSRCLAVKGSKPPCRNRCNRNYVYRRHNERQ